LASWDVIPPTENLVILNIGKWIAERDGGIVDLTTPLGILNTSRGPDVGCPKDFTIRTLEGIVNKAKKY